MLISVFNVIFWALNLIFCSFTYRMSWGMLCCLFLQTSKIFQMLWMLLRSLTSLVFTPFANDTGTVTKSLLSLCSQQLWSLSDFIEKSCFIPFRYIQSTCATSGEGLYEGLDWLSNNIANKVGSTVICWLKTDLNLMFNALFLIIFSCHGRLEQFVLVGLESDIFGRNLCEFYHVLCVFGFIYIFFAFHKGWTCLC